MNQNDCADDEHKILDVFAAVSKPRPKKSKKISDNFLDDFWGDFWWRFSGAENGNPKKRPKTIPKNLIENPFIFIFLDETRLSKKLARESSKIFNSKSFHFYFFGRLFFWNEFWAFFWTTPLGDVFWTPENFLDGGFWTAFFLESTFLGDPCGRTRKKLHDLLGGFWKSNLIHCHRHSTVTCRTLPERTLSNFFRPPCPEIDLQTRW